MERVRYCHGKWSSWAASLIVPMVALCGCSHGPAAVTSQAGPSKQKVFELKEIAPPQAMGLLSELDPGTAAILPGRNALAVTGSSSDLYRASLLLELVDTREEFVIETLAPMSDARAVPANREIAEALGGIALGTFANPPPAGEHTRALIDIHGESVIAVIPTRLHRELVAFIKLGPDGLRRIQGEPVTKGSHEVPRREAPAMPEERADLPSPADREAAQDVASAAVPPEAAEPNVGGTAQEVAAKILPQSATAMADTPCESVEVAGDRSLPSEPVVASVGQQQESSDSAVEALDARPAGVAAAYESPALENGNDVLELDLPDRLEMIQLLDLVAEYLNLDYMFEPEKIRGQSVSLRLHGKMRGEIRVKDLYPLLESVLKFKGFAMTCHKGNLVTIVPVTDALTADPALIDSTGGSMEAGDMVVTRVFALQYVNTASAMNLLENMKLSVAAAPVEETGSLIVTCYAHRMDRIERLLSMVDRPGKPKEFRYRQLKYTMANTLTKKVEALVAELQTMPIRVAPMEQKPSAPVLTVSAPAPASSSLRKPSEATASESAERYTVYLDADERTNRILMIGHAEQLAIVEEVVDALDVAQHDPRMLKVYDIVHLNAAEARKKLEELEVIGKAKKAESTAPSVFVSKAASSDRITGTGSVETAVTAEMQVTVLDSTNSLLVNATDEQHARIADVLEYVDVVEQDLRSLKVYDMKYVDAEEVKKQLAEFELIGKKGKSAEPSTAEPETPTAAAAGGSPEPAATMHEPQVSVLESTNALLINATEFQHARMSKVIDHVDTAAREEAIPYEIYFLENQEPEHLAEVLQKILQETVQDKEAKVEKVVRRSEEEIVIVPDQNTFSLIVYASKKNQEWISKLIKTLDKRRPQVLIDATLVEITKADAFTYDLNLLGTSDVAGTSGMTGADPNIMGKFFQSSSGLFTAFYGDQHIQALLEAMESKNYGRVLAKPKILVNDNEPGMIKTTDVTYVETTSSIPVTSGTAGPQTNFVETAVRFEPYEAGITLDITPHISEGDLLRLDIALTRSDFLETENPKKPPNTRSNEVTTKVTVPDGSTIILGGLLKLNQNKGSRKVPLLGDIPLIGGLFRGISNKDTQNKLYVFVKAEIIRPVEDIGEGIDELTALSERDRQAFERHELEFQDYESWPGIKPEPVAPAKVLDVR